MQPNTDYPTAAGDIAQWLDLACRRPCPTCGSYPGGAGIERCTERFGGAPRLLVAALGSHGELALVPLFSDGDCAVGCVAIDELALLRSSLLIGLDKPDKEAVEAAGGKLSIAGTYGHSRVGRLIESASGVVAWNVSALFPAVDASVLRETPVPSRTLTHPDATRYGRWPAPWLEWRSLSAAIPWDEAPFRQPCGQAPAGSAMAALAAVGLPMLRPDAHPLAKALALAVLLRTCPWKGEREPLGARLLPVRSMMSVVGLCRGEVYRLASDAKWERLFAHDPDAQELCVEDIEQAAGHMRMVDAITAPAEARGVQQ